MTLLGDDAPYSHKTISWGDGPTVTFGDVFIDGETGRRWSNEGAAWRPVDYATFANTNTITINVGNVSPEVVAILTGTPQAETLL